MTIPEGNITPNTPQAEQATNETLEHVEDATQQVTEAVTSAPTDAIQAMLASVKDVLQGVQAELKRSNDRAEKTTESAASTVVTPVEPIIDVETPPKQERHVRRNGRKVKRNG